MKFIWTLVLLAISMQSFSQEKLFSDAPEKIKRYQKLSSEFWEKGDSIKARSYQMDSTKNCLINALIDSYQFTTIKGGVLKTDEINKPLFILVAASWCAPCKTLIDPLNKIVEKYHDKIQFIVLFWDTKEKLEELQKSYSDQIALVPSLTKSSTEGMMPLNIAGFNHSIGYPTQYLIKNKRIIDYFTGAAVSEVNMLNALGKMETKVVGTKDEVFKANYKLLEDNMKKLLSL